jgi:hypothetical protein
VLVYPDLAARPEDPADLLDRPPLVRHGAQHVARHHRVEGVVGEREVLGHAPEDADGCRRPAGPAGGPGGHGGLRLHGHHLDPPPVPFEVQARPGPELQDPAPEAADQLRPVLLLRPAAQSDHRIP